MKKRKAAGKPATSNVISKLPGFPKFRHEGNLNTEIHFPCILLCTENLTKKQIMTPLFKPVAPQPLNNHPSVLSAFYRQRPTLPETLTAPKVQLKADELFKLLR